LFKSNSIRLLQGDNAYNALFGGAPKKIPPRLSLRVITENDSSAKTPRSNSNTNFRLPVKTPRSNSNNTNLELSAKTPRSNSNKNLGLSASFLSLQSTPPPPTQNLFENQNLNLSNQYSKESFNKKNFINISSAGKQSNMMVSSDKNYYFKKYSSKDPAQTKKNLENECRVYAYLGGKNLVFLANCTCFVNCFTNGILLKNGGNSLEQMLNENTFTFSEDYFKQFFYKLHELHKLLVTHNDLHVGNVVGYVNVLFIDFGLATIYPLEVLDENFLQLIYDAFSGLFFALCTKYEIV
jgi:hypothetical protein